MHIELLDDFSSQPFEKNSKQRAFYSKVFRMMCQSQNVIVASVRIKTVSKPVVDGSVLICSVGR